MSSSRLPVPGFVVVCILASVGCGGRGSSAPPTIDSFASNPTSLPVGGGRAELSWSVTGAETLTLTPGGEVTGESRSVELTATTRYVLTATNANGSVTSELTITVAETGTVEGRVVTLAGQPLANVQVAIADQPVVTTGSDGRFSVPGVKPPYDAVLMPGTDALVMVYQGLTTMTPELFREEYPPEARSTTVSGTVTGGEPAGQGVVTSVMYSVNGQYGTKQYANAGGHNSAVSWNGEATASATVYALQYTFVNDLPASYHFAQADLTLTDGAPSTVDLGLAPHDGVAISGTVQVPAGFGVPALDMAVSFGGVTQFLVDSGSGDSFSYLAPSVGTVSIEAFSWNDSGDTSHRVAGVSGTATLELPEPPQLLAPVHQAMGVDAQTEFSWTKFPAGTHVVHFASPDAGELSFRVITDATRMKLPSYPSLGLTLSPGTAYRWWVAGYGPASSVNDAAALLAAEYDRSKSLVVAEAYDYEFTTAGAAPLRAEVQRGP